MSKRLLALLLPLVVLTAVVALPVQAQVTIPNPIKCADATCLITQIIRYVLGTIAVIATMMFVWGGILMLTSAGNEKRVEQAKETLAWAAIGVVVILLSWTLIKFVLSALIT